MPTYAHTFGGQIWRFASLAELLAKASPERSGDHLAGIAAGDDEERAAAQLAKSLASAAGWGSRLMPSAGGAG